MAQTCQLGVWGHDPDPELGVEGHDPDHHLQGSEGLWGHALNPMTGPIQPKFMRRPGLHHAPDGGGSGSWPHRHDAWSL